MSFVNVAFDKGGILNNFIRCILASGQYFTMQVSKCRHIHRLVPTVTRDGKPKATLEGCLVIANETNATISARHHANLLTRKPLQKHIKEDLSYLQSKATRALVNTCLFVTTVDLS